MTQNLEKCLRNSKTITEIDDLVCWKRRVLINNKSLSVCKFSNFKKKIVYDNDIKQKFEIFSRYIYIYI